MEKRVYKPYYLRDDSERIVATGLGCVSPLGPDLPTTWKRMLAGYRGGIATIDPRYGDFSDQYTQIAGQAIEFEGSKYLDRKQARKAHRSAQLAIDPTVEALEDAEYKLEPTVVEIDAGNGQSTKENRYKIAGVDAERIGDFVGTCIGGSPVMDDIGHTIRTRGADRANPIGPLLFLLDRVPGVSSIQLGLGGPLVAPEGACGTGAVSIILASWALREGAADVMVAGGSDAAITPMGIGTFGRGGALSTRNDAPQDASRSFDTDADGFIMSEGAGIVVLETLKRAKDRGAKIYAELVGWGWTSDAYHETAPSGFGAVRAQTEALWRANLNAREVRYKSPHATSTPKGDAMEGWAIGQVYGTDNDYLIVGPTKSMTGHMLGAAGAIESIVVIKAITDGLIPPRVNLVNPVSTFLRYPESQAMEVKVDIASSNSFGFSGINTDLIWKRYDPEDDARRRKLA